MRKRTERRSLVHPVALFDREQGCSDPLYVAEELRSLKSSGFSGCKACAKSLEGWATKERERIWRLIPH